ncbi:MAG: amino acid racemase [Terracidiphilus sp.]|jgi:aspartate racemase
MTLKSDIGVIGGMGPLASAAFVRSLYGMYQGQLEQSLPSVTLYSDPSFADRTATFLGGGDFSPMLRKLEDKIRKMLADGMERIVICCMTAHYLVPMLPLELRQHIVSLVDIAVEELHRTRKRCLIACTTGATKLRIFQDNPEWYRAAPFAVFPTDAEQEQLHTGIYRLKREHITEPLAEIVAFIAAAHRVEAILAGCTELHLLSPLHAGSNRLNQTYDFLDPLTAVARLWMEEEHASEVYS